MKVFYDEGPETIRFGPHEMRINEPKDLPDETAKDLLRKGRVKKYDAEMRRGRDAEKR
jgi:hypothetical protein